MWSLSVCQNFHTSEKKNLLQTIDLYWINVSVFYTETRLIAESSQQSRPDCQFATDPTVSSQICIWFWMTPQSPKHDQPVDPINCL
jgi:hypothetical protein